MTQHSNIILIGMPGCGKSTVGVVLAKTLGYGFIDTDLLIQQSHRKRLQDIVNEEGFLALRQMEEGVLTSLATVQQVIATGGSAIYSDKGMQHLKSLGKIIYLQLGLNQLKERVGDYSERGIASDPHSSFETIYNERCPLYQQAADVVIDCDDKSIDEIIVNITEQSQ